jgi:hypothetical protein
VGQNQLKYTGLTYDDIQAQITNLLYTDSRFDRFRESSVAQTLIEVFTGTTDILNYYLNRRAEETFFDTAQLKSSVLSLSRMLGYVSNRAEPAHAFLKLTIKGNIEDNQIQIPYNSKFSYGGNNYVLLNTLTYRLNPSQYNVMTGPNQENFTLSITKGTQSFKGNTTTHDIEIIQGDIREKVINGNNNTQVGAPFQMYKIDDKTFSNVYGDKDYFHNKITKVWVGDNKSESTQFMIDRRSLLSWDAINSSLTNLSNAQSVCLIRTATDGSVELLFGDADPTVENTDKNPQATGGFSRKGPLTQLDNIYVQYLSTKGSAANSNSVVGDKIEFSGKIYNSSGRDITSNISFTLNSNIFGGADEESLDSIKYSAPKIYYSLDRLVSSQDYIAYLKSLTYPINVKNALAWGEQEERNRAGKFALVKMFNVVLFTLMGSMYGIDKVTKKYYSKSVNQYFDTVLDLNYNPYTFQTQGYFNVYMVQDMVNQLEQYTFISTNYNISSDNFYKEDSTLESIAETVYNKIKTQYPNSSCVISFDYTSDDPKSSSNIQSSGDITVNLGAIQYTGSGDGYFNSLAMEINRALSEFKDGRGNKNENVNFGYPAFIGSADDSGTIFKWDTETSQTGNSTSYRFVVKFDNDGTSDDANDGTNKCYITQFKDDSILGILNLLYKESYPVSTTKYGSENNGKISGVINDLSKRSQISVKNIYVSPIIHRFNVVGTIYVKSLYDIESVKSDIMQSVYSWADQFADFNVPIYLSNIMEIVESHQGVINANIRLQPEDITSGVDNVKNTYYDPYFGTNSIYKKYGTSGDTPIGGILATTINDALATYLSTSSYNTSGARYEYTSFTDSKPDYQKTLECYSYTLNNYITERTFYDKFAGPLYRKLVDCGAIQYKNGVRVVNENGETVYVSPYDCKGQLVDSPNYALFLQYNYDNNNGDNPNDMSYIHHATLSSDFALIMQQIYKDLSYIIMVNMLDSHGNIETEYNSLGDRVRGGYSLGSEIVQLNLAGTSRDNNTQLLKFEYKD